jgi:hypothetical protein
MAMAKRRVAAGRDDAGFSWTGGSQICAILSRDNRLPDTRRCRRIEPVAVSSLARCAQETLENLERNWRTPISALRER